MIALVLATCIQSERLWATCSQNAALVDCVGIEAVGVLEGRKLTIKRPDGTNHKILTLGTGRVPLWYDEEREGAITTAERTLSLTSEREADEFPVLVQPEVFAVQGGLFAKRLGISYLGDDSVVSLPNTALYGNVCIDTMKSTIAAVTRNLTGTPSSVIVARKRDHEWIIEETRHCPEFEKVCLLTQAPVAQDVRFVSDKIIAFVASPTALYLGAELATLDKHLIDVTQFPLNTPSPRMTSYTGYLVLMRITDGWTKPVAKLSFNMSKEGMHFGLGGMSVTSSYSSLFLLTSAGVLRFDVKALMKLAEFD